ncbi:SH3 domain-containing protein [Methylobacterium organophilum]|uniref:SH3 domain-containing protein n=1 Tax=Methylobacterium organophilum TaxID=410 RepID=UPI001F144CB5|nr:SH3 domain-containing protein [Methylobacterium organophilum]UMY18375.1 SH3 domain-containing protein [Methylobacterium organophilum]
MIRSLALAALLVTGAGPVLAAPESFRVDGLPRDDSLTIRETPDAGAPALGQIPVGRRVMGFGCTADTPSRLTWCRVKFGRTVGWARRRYLTPD